MTICVLFTNLIIYEIFILDISECNQLSLVSQPLMAQLREELAPIADSGPWELRDRAKILNGLIGAPTNCGESQPQAMEH